jgi:hypothetical protein
MKESMGDTMSEPDSFEESSEDIDGFRNCTIESVARIYKLLQDDRQSLLADEYSRRRHFLDELTKEVSRISFLPDDEVQAAYEDFGLGLSGELCDWFIRHIMPYLESDFEENQQFSFVLDWEFVTIVTLRNYLIDG